MLTVLMLLLSLPPGPTWHPNTAPPEQALPHFKAGLKLLPTKLRPSDTWQLNCFWASYLIGMAEEGLRSNPKNSVAKAIKAEAEKHIEDKCKGPRSKALWEKHAKAILFLAGRGTSDAHRERLPEPPAGAPFPLPPLPDRAGGDLGTPLPVMFATLEDRLAKGGHPLTGEARACAWASSSLAAARAVQRTAGATEGIGAGVKVLDARVTQHCRGDALKAKEAAWAWLRANPAATMPLAAQLKPATPAWPAPTPADGALWLASALLFGVPEAWPAILTLTEAAAH